MKLDNFLQLFVVKEKRFFPLFIKQSELILQGAKLLVEITHETDQEKRNSIAHSVKELESACDKVTDKILDELIVAFVTPFDREDIHTIASMMDTFMDCLHDCAKKFSIYQPKGEEPKLSEIAGCLLKDAEYVNQATLLFDSLRKNSKELDAICDNIKEDEHIVDDLYESYMSHIFQNESDLVELVKKKNIVEALEETSDHTKQLSDAIRTVIVKMS
ncbi:MAG: DUF47 family protein [Bacteroidales bacterium]|nr:DUF47 family protein [Bacteroidales bacterium]